MKKNISTKQWQDWRWQLANVITSFEELNKTVKLPRVLVARYKKLFKILARPGFDAVRLTPYLLSLINWRDMHDPILLQHLPSKAELKPDDFELNKIWERADDFVDGQNRFIQQKYPDIVLLRLASTCHSFCRFCFEKERTLRGQVKTAIGREQFKQALKYIKQQPQVRQILVSGGDPLIIPDEVLFKYLLELIKLPQISLIRINTRTLLHNPFRITESFVKKLAALQTASWDDKQRERGVSVEIGVHFNHPNELTQEALDKIRKLRQAEIGVYNQTVLLKGINDQPEIIIKLFRKLRAENVRLHYLSHAMPVPATSHLRTEIKTGMQIMSALRKSREFRGQLPHFETSHYTGKQIVPEEFNKKFKQIKIKNKPVVRFVSDITGRSEVQR